jgi:hypothetical protein
MKKLTSILILYFSIVQTIFSQHSIRGIVRDYDSGDILSNAEVFVDTLGYYKLNELNSYYYYYKNPKKLKRGFTDKSGAFQIDSIFSKRIDLVLKGGKCFPFVVENIVFNNLDINLGEIFLLRGHHDGPDEPPTFIYNYMGRNGNKEIELRHPLSLIT